MASWRKRKRRMQRNLFLAGIAAIAVAYWCWPRTGRLYSETQEAGLNLLAGTRPIDQPSSGIERMIPPSPPAADPVAEVDAASAASDKPRPETPGNTDRAQQEDSTANRPVGLPGSPATQPAPNTAMSAVAVPAAEALQAAVAARDAGRLLEARMQLNQALQTGLPSQDIPAARETLSDLSQRTLLTRVVLDNDPLVVAHIAAPGQTLGRIADNYRITEDLLAEVNGIANKHLIRQGQRIKALRGPFHATVSKSDHLMHLYLQDTYVRTFRVALGIDGGTPTGKWKVKDKLPNPGWTDPRTGKRWHPDDPNNPIGEYWIGLEGIEGNAVGQFGYGIHGTIEPETIGRDVSLGCIRLAADDIAAVYKMLVVGHSLVTVGD